METTKFLFNILTIISIAFAIGIAVLSTTSAHGLRFLNGSVQYVPPKDLTIKIGLSSDPVRIGFNQDAIITVIDKNTSDPIPNANISTQIVNSSRIHISGPCSLTDTSLIGNSKVVVPQTDDSGQYKCSWTIGKNTRPGIYTIAARADKDDYKSTSATRQYLVK